MRVAADAAAVVEADVGAAFVPKRGREERPEGALPDARVPGRQRRQPEPLRVLVEAQRVLVKAAEHLGPAPYVGVDVGVGAVAPQGEHPGRDPHARPGPAHGHLGANLRAGRDGGREVEVVRVAVVDVTRRRYLRRCLRRRLRLWGGDDVVPPEPSFAEIVPVFPRPVQRGLLGGHRARGRLRGALPAAVSADRVSRVDSRRLHHDHHHVLRVHARLDAQSPREVVDALGIPALARRAYVHRHRRGVRAVAHAPRERRVFVPAEDDGDLGHLSKNKTRCHQSNRPCGTEIDVNSPPPPAGHLPEASGASTRRSRRRMAPAAWRAPSPPGPPPRTPRRGVYARRTTAWTWYTPR